MKSKHRVAVVGAGISGLAAAVSLAARGVDVTVLESAESPGGKIRQTVTPLGAVDKGPTVLTLRWIFDELLDLAGTSLEDSVNIRQLEVLAHHRWSDGSTLNLHANHQANLDAIAGFSGQRAVKEFEKFTRLTTDLYRVLLPSYMQSAQPGMTDTFRSAGIGGMLTMARARPFSSLWNHLGRVFTDPRLRQLYARYATYCGSSPFLAPATLMLIAHVEQLGVWSIDGGMLELARTLERAAKACGATFRYGSRMTGLDIRLGQVAAVRLADESSVMVDHVIVTADLRAVADGQLGNELQSLFRSQPAREPSLSAVTWSGTAVIRCEGLDYHNVVFSDDYPAEFEAIIDGQSMPADPTIYICTPDRGAISDPGQHTHGERVFMLINAPPAIKGSDSNQLYLQEANLPPVLDRLESCGLKLEAEGADWQYTTPEDFNHRFPGSGGSLYGSATHGWRSAFTRQSVTSKIPGVFFAGGGVHPGPGVPMVALSGKAAAKQVWQSIEQRAGRRRN